MKWLNKRLFKIYVR